MGRLVLYIKYPLFTYIEVYLTYIKSVFEL